MPLLPLANEPAHIAFVVDDLDLAVAAWSARGVGPWRIFRVGPGVLQGMSVRGETQSYAMRLAFASTGGRDYELVEPLDDASIYADHLARVGPGMHHLGYSVDDIDAVTVEMNTAGYATLQTGRGVGASGDGAFVYFDTTRDFGCITEAVQRPSQMWEPERVVESKV